MQFDLLYCSRSSDFVSKYCMLCFRLATFFSKKVIQLVKQIRSMVSSIFLSSLKLFLYSKSMACFDGQSKSSKFFLYSNFFFISCRATRTSCIWAASASITNSYFHNLIQIDSDSREIKHILCFLN